MYPLHEAQTRPQSPEAETPPEGQAGAARINVQTVCNALKITKSVYDVL